MVQSLETHRPGKRRKLDVDTPRVMISSVADLNQLLISHQQSLSECKAAMLQFKDFLTSITRSADGDDRAFKLQILKECSQIQPCSTKRAAIFPDLTSPWSSAIEANNETLLSLIPSVFALYLKIISSQLDLREAGLSLCKYLLLKDQLRLFDRGLTASRTKDHLISPCIRLLTEIVSFDGGEVAHLVYLNRETTLRHLDVFLEQRTSSLEEVGDGDQKPTLRRITQRYLLANLKFQSVGARDDLIAHGRALKVCLHGLRNDKSDIVCDVLSSLEKQIVLATSLSARVKSRLFDGASLSLLAGLYVSHDAANESCPQRSPRTLVDKLLRLVCTQHVGGVLIPETGWYPIGSAPGRTIPLVADPSHIEVITDSAAQHDCVRTIPVRNMVLSSFIHVLKPETDKLQASLLLDIFRATPELVANYFSRKKNFVTEPKDTPGWLGQSAFLFSAIQLPVPKFCGWKEGFPALPPPSPIVIENILPRPLGRTYMTRSLNLGHEVITLFAVRALTVAFEKLNKVLKTYPGKWSQASSDLVLAFGQRSPLPKDVLSTLHRTPKSDEQLRVAITELMTKYHQTLPHLMLTEKFDVSLALIETVRRIEENVNDESLRSLRYVELENLLKIAQTSSDTKWWQTPESLQFSLFTSILRNMLTAGESTPSMLGIRQIMSKVAVSQGVLPDQEGYFSALLSSWRADGSLLEMKSMSFFDNCASRIARQPVYYQDLTASEEVGHAGVCLLQVCIAEQWPFLTEQEDLSGQKIISEWIIRLSILFIQAGENKIGIEKLQTQMTNAISDATLRKRIVTLYDEEKLKIADSQAQPRQQDETAAPPEPQSGNESDRVLSRLDALFPQPQVRGESMDELENLHKDNVEESARNGLLSQLCISLSSPLEESRRRGLIILQATMKQIELSDYSERGPMFVMTGEFIESIRAFGIARPLPSILSEFAAEAVMILSQPSHAMYGQINGFLQKGPSWEALKFIRYWLSKFLLLEPEDDTRRSQEITWLLNLLILGLRGEEDLELYRKGSVLERLLALYLSRLCAETHRRQILELVFRSINLGGGMTLATRMGVESWFNLTTADGRNAELVQDLTDKLHDSIDGQAFQRWKVPIAKV